MKHVGRTSNLVAGGKLDCNYPILSYFSLTGLPAACPVHNSTHSFCLFGSKCTEVNMVRSEFVYNIILVF